MSVEFLGLRFAPVRPEHRFVIGEILASHPQPLSDFTVASLLAWAPVYRYHLSLFGSDTLLLCSLPDPDASPTLLQPVGTFPEQIQRAILERASESREPLRIESASEEFLSRHPAFASRFDVAANRDSANYVYSAEDLAELRGRRYSKKRNLIAQASRTYAWTVESLGPESAKECLRIDVDIARERTPEAAITPAQEAQALARAVELFAPLGLRGLLLRVGGEPAAFSIFDRLSPTTAVVLFERAVRSEIGLYQVINRETARAIAADGFTWINREEDLGDPGLRQAKLSYHPARLEMKYTLSLATAASIVPEEPTAAARHATPPPRRRERVYGQPPDEGTLGLEPEPMP